MKTTCADRGAFDSMITIIPSKGWAWWVKGPSKRADKNYCRPEAKHDGKRPKDWAPKRQKEKKQAATSKSIIRNQTGCTH